MLAKRQAFVEALPQLDPARLWFIDETAIRLDFTRLYGRAPGGQRCHQAVPNNAGEALTLVAALGPDGLQAVLELPGALNQTAFSVYLQDVLGPCLQPGDVVVLDNLPAHKAADGRFEAIVAQRGARLLYLPPYSPDFSPIELAFSKLKTGLRTAAARTKQALDNAVAKAISWITQHDARNWFAHCGYHAQ